MVCSVPFTRSTWKSTEVSQWDLVAETQWVWGQSTSLAKTPENRCRLYARCQRGGIGREVTVERVVGWEFILSQLTREPLYRCELPQRGLVWSYTRKWFLPCDAMCCTVFVIVILSVCPSVCPSVTLVDCVHTVRRTIMISSPYGSPIILVSGDITFIPKFEGSHPEWGRWMRVGWVRIDETDAWNFSLQCPLPKNNAKIIYEPEAGCITLLTPCKLPAV